MFEDQFYDIQRGEIYDKSQCIWHEHRTFDFISSVLINLGWEPLDPWRRQWQRDQRSVILCLADDFLICGGNRSAAPSDWFDKETTVITDNHVTFVAHYEMLSLPSSYFGIFSYEPSNVDWQPQRDIGFSINRMDSQRIALLMSLAQAFGGPDQLLARSYINFNGKDSQGANDSIQNLRANWDKYLREIVVVDPDMADQLRDLLPIKNHNKSVEQAHVSVWLNCVIETYAGDHTHAFSEKIFRALSTPAPWVVFSARGAVDYLRSLGFDTLDDIVDHCYDQDLHHKKLYTFAQQTLLNLDRIRKHPEVQIRARCLEAAQQNRSVLTNLRKQWPGDFAAWLPGALDKLR